jgi:hypothetical protein
MVRHPTGIITVRVASLQATLIHVDTLSHLQVRVNKMLMDNLFSKITQLQSQHGGSLVKSGTTRRLLGEYAAFLYFCALETETFLPD